MSYFFSPFCVGRALAFLGLSHVRFAKTFQFLLFLLCGGYSALCDLLGEIKTWKDVNILDVLGYIWIPWSTVTSSLGTPFPVLFYLFYLCLFCQFIGWCDLVRCVWIHLAAWARLHHFPKYLNPQDTMMEVGHEKCKTGVFKLSLERCWVDGDGEKESKLKLSPSNTRVSA